MHTMMKFEWTGTFQPFLLEYDPEKLTKHLIPQNSGGQMHALMKFEVAGNCGLRGGCQLWTSRYVLIGKPADNVFVSANESHSEV